MANAAGKTHAGGETSVVLIDDDSDAGGESDGDSYHDEDAFFLFSSKQPLIDCGSSSSSSSGSGDEDGGGGPRSEASRSPFILTSKVEGPECHRSLSSDDNDDICRSRHTRSVSASGASTSLTRSVQPAADAMTEMREELEKRKRIKMARKARSQIDNRNSSNYDDSEVVVIEDSLPGGEPGSSGGAAAIGTDPHQPQQQEEKVNETTERGNALEPGRLDQDLQNIPIALNGICQERRRRSKRRRRFFNCILRFVTSEGQSLHSSTQCDDDLTYRQEQDASFQGLFSFIRQKYPDVDPTLLYGKDRLYKYSTPRVVRMSHPPRGHCLILVFLSDDLYQQYLSQMRSVRRGNSLNGDVDGVTLAEATTRILEQGKGVATMHISIRLRGTDPVAVPCTQDTTLHSLLESLHPSSGSDLGTRVRIEGPDGDLLPLDATIRSAGLEDEDLLNVMPL